MCINTTVSQIMLYDACPSTSRVTPTLPLRTKCHNPGSNTNVRITSPVPYKCDDDR